ncbi:MAG: outer membrane protein assembly factor BamD [Planctomycetes bacterium]|nr:outer membrane protein assembly factor BamD [Planctomycetota bacterium]
MRLRLNASNLGRLAKAGTTCMLLSMLTGCPTTKPFQSDPTSSAKTSGDSMVIKAGHVQEKPATTFKGAADLAAAEDFYREKEYKKAGKLFGRVADDTSNPPLQAEKARFFEAECKRMQEYYVDAMSTYNRLLKDFQYGVYREQAVARMYEICSFWLQDTRAQIQAELDKADGKKASVPWNFIHFDKRKPTFDQEGHALKMLEQVYYNDPTGPNAERALYDAGYIHFHRGEYKEADDLLTQLIDMNERNGGKSAYRDRAIELAILAKNNISGGAAYDGRKAAESLKLIHQAKMSSPELVNQKGDFLDKQMKMIRYIQAEKDYEIAEFYNRTGHPASAWFYYELVRRRYNGTEFHDRAVARMKEINGDLADGQQKSEFAKATRREWNKWMLGHDVPTLAKEQAVPAVPGVLPESRNAVVPVDAKQSVPSEIMPRR